MIKKSQVVALFLAFTFVLALTGIAQQQAEETVTCPVSGEVVKKSEAKASYEYKGKMYYFCCEACKEKFVKEPEKYIKKEQKHMHHEEKMHHEKKAHHEEHMHMKAGEKAHQEMMELLTCLDIKMSVENLENGIAVKITSENADVVKKIHEKAAKMKAMNAKKCEKEAKKEEEKK